MSDLTLTAVILSVLCLCVGCYLAGYSEGRHDEAMREVNREEA